MRPKALLLVLITVLFASVLVTGCKKNNTQQVITPTGTGPVCGNASYARAIHAIPCAPAVDVYVNGRQVQCNLPFTKATEYAAFKPDKYQITVYPTGTTTNPLINTCVNLKSQQNFSIIAAGTLDCPGPIVLTDYSGDIPNDLAVVRFINLVPDSQPMNAYLDVDKIKLAGGAEFGKASDYINIPPGNYNLTVTPAASLCPCIATVPCLALEPGKAYTIAAEGLMKDNSVQVVTYIDK